MRSERQGDGQLGAHHVGLCRIGLDVLKSCISKIRTFPQDQGQIESIGIHQMKSTSVRDEEAENQVGLTN